MLVQLANENRERMFVVTEARRNSSRIRSRPAEDRVPREISRAEPPIRQNKLWLTQFAELGVGEHFSQFVCFDLLSFAFAISR